MMRYVLSFFFSFMFFCDIDWDLGLGWAVCRLSNFFF